MIKKIAWVIDLFRRQDSIRKKENPFSVICENHFRHDLDLTEMQFLFKQSVKMVEIEVFSFCNRKCWFCPNSFVDRHSENIHMKESIYNCILEDLKKISFSNMISYSRYNEPLADEIIFERIKAAREALPQATLHMNSNGDYLTTETLKELKKSGLSSLNVQVYFPNGMDYSDEAAYRMVMEKVNKLNLKYKEVVFKKKQRLEYQIFFKGMDIRIYSRNFLLNGNYRGGTVKKLKKKAIRKSPCLIPFYDMYIDFNGKVVPCCNIRSDIPEHKNYVIGDLNMAGSNLFKIFSSKEIIFWRKNLYGFGKKISPCDYCSFKEIELSKINRRLAKNVYKKRLK